MALDTTTTYTIRNAFTKNVLAQIPGGPGLKGFCAWGGLTAGLSSMIGWNLVAQGSDYQVINNFFTTSAIAGDVGGDVFVYAEGTVTDQIWIIEAVSGLYSTYTMKNAATDLLAFDPSACGATGLPQSVAEIDRYNPARFYWTFSAQE